jgi:CBS domain-containing protein
MYMNLLYFLSPKQDLMYVYDDFTLRQTLEKWENNRYASIPILNRKGEYVGTLTEGDILWSLKRMHGLDLEGAEDVPILSLPRKKDYQAVTVTTGMDQLIEAAMNQNFVPVVDDRGIFIGIVRRQAIIRYCYEMANKTAAPRTRKHISAEMRSRSGALRFSTEPELDVPEGRAE